MRPRILDLFCGAGGAAMGYHRAGFDVVGVDIELQPRYPFEFIQADAMTFCHLFAGEIAAVHASPPCQDHSVSKSTHPAHGTDWMLDATRDRLVEWGIPWVIENVPGAPMLSAPSLFGEYHGLMLCGSMFGLGVKRHRLFESSIQLSQPQCQHDTQGPTLGVTGHGEQGHVYERFRKLGLPVPGQKERAEAMGIDWMDRDTLAQAIPPAYTEFIGTQLLATLEAQ